MAGNLIKQTIKSIKNQGLKHTLKTVRNWLFHPEMRRENRLNPRLRYDKVDQLIKKIDFTKNYENGLLKNRANNDKIEVGWIISPFHIGSGGHQTIFRFIKYLENNGYHNSLYITDGHGFSSEQEAYDTIQNHFMNIPNITVKFLTEEEVVSGEKVVKDCDYLVSTRFNTAYYSCLIDNCKKRLYFVQDLENLFFATSYMSVLVENSYKMGMIGICASPWLANTMKSYGMKAYGFYLGYDNKIYIDKKLQREAKSIAFYGRFESERRAVELGMQALEIVQKKIPELKAYIYGSNYMLEGYDVNVVDMGILNYQQMSELFNKVDVGLSFSLTNYGLTPTEMMGCGLPVIELDGDNTRSVFKNGENILLAQKNPNAVADSIIELFDNEEKRNKLRNGGFEFIKDKKWDDIWSGTEKYLKSLLKE